MKQHPVPQNITSYQFRLVGEMTLKQFSELAGGLILAYLFFSLKISAVIKFPLAGFFAFLGFALAFLPIQERPLDQWIVNFIKSVYSPTRYFWQKDNPLPSYLQPATAKSHRPKEKNNASFKKTRRAVEEYLKSLPSQAPADPLGQTEKTRLQQINQLLKTVPAPKVLPQKKAVKPQTLPPSVSFSTVEEPVIEPAPPLTPPIAVKSDLNIKQKVEPEVAAMFSGQFNLPAQPDVANLVVGVVLSPEKRILPQCLIEVKNDQGTTVRALKTNKLGQFFMGSPLPNGQYQLLVESEDYNFDIIKLKAEGKIIPPLKIKAQEKKNY